MKKLMISAIMAFALMTSVSVMAQDAKKKDAATKEKTEACCKKDGEKKEGDKKECCKKEGEKKACCSKKEEPKK